MKTQAIQSLIQASYSVPNGHNLRKACYQYMKLNSRKAFMSDITDYVTTFTMSTDKKEQAEATADGLLDIFSKVKDSTVDTVSKIVQQAPEAKKFIVESIKDPTNLGQNAEKLLLSSVKEFDLTQYAKQYNLNEKQVKYIQDEIKKEALYRYKSTKEELLHYVPEQIKESLWENHVKKLWEQKHYVLYFKELYDHSFVDLGKYLDLDPHTLETTTTVFVGMVLAYILFRNLDVVKKVAVGLLKVLAAPLELIIKGIASVSKWFYNLIFGKAKKKVRRAALREAMKTGNKKVIVLASYL